MHMGPGLNDRILARILESRPENVLQILSELDLSGVPAQEQVHAQIEDALLLPSERLPEPWLSTYQM